MPSAQLVMYRLCTKALLMDERAIVWIMGKAKQSNNSLIVVNSLTLFSLFFPLLFFCSFIVENWSLITVFAHLTPALHTAVLDLLLTVCVIQMAKCFYHSLHPCGYAKNANWIQFQMFCINNLKAEHLFKTLFYLDLHSTWRLPTFRQGTWSCE